jgi:hypothetical protein
MAGLAPTASAQSTKDDGIRPALLSQQEFIETLADITPELLHLQQEVVNTLSTDLEDSKNRRQTGALTIDSYTDTEQSYYRELESLQIMKARLDNKSISAKKILKIRIAVRSDALASLKRLSESVKESRMAGTAGVREVAAAEVKVLKAEIVLEALKRAAGE